MEIITTSLYAQTFGGPDFCQADMMCVDDTQCPPFNWVPPCLPYCPCEGINWGCINPLCPPVFLAIIHSIFEH